MYQKGLKLGILILGLALLIIIILSIIRGCKDNYSRPATPLIILPADEGPHDSVREWWYFNGLLTDDHGQKYSYHYVTFYNKGHRVPITSQPW